MTDAQKYLLAVRIQGRPTHASQVIRPSVRTLLSVNPRIAATAENTAVHAPWVETALNPIETPRMPEPLTNTQSANC
jgi:hypothetical protein